MVFAVPFSAWFSVSRFFLRPGGSPSMSGGVQFSAGTTVVRLFCKGVSFWVLFAFPSSDLVTASCRVFGSFHFSQARRLVFRKVPEPKFNPLVLDFPSLVDSLST